MFVLHIVILIYTVFVAVYAPAMGMSMLDPRMIIYNALAGLALVSYTRAVLTDPGRVPKDGQWSQKDSPPEQGLRWCGKEKLWKPVRTHYCSALSRNVLKMDHYCPWLANCVGYFNHKYFYLFTLYSTLLADWTAYGTVSLLASKTAFLSPSHVFLLTHGSVLSSILGLVLTPFCAFHTYLLLNNATTLEFCEGRDLGKFSKQSILGNINQALGSNPLLWLLPVRTEASNGLLEGKQVTGVDSSSKEDDESPVDVESVPSVSTPGTPWFAKAYNEYAYMCCAFTRILVGKPSRQTGRASIHSSTRRVLDDDIRGFLDPA